MTWELASGLIILAVICTMLDRWGYVCGFADGYEQAKGERDAHQTDKHDN